MGLVDLHVHSTFSGDAEHTWQEVIDLAVRAGVTLLSLPEHDDLRSARLAGSCADLPVTLLPGVEVSTRAHGEEIHVLGYGIDPHHGPLVRLLEDIRARQEQQAMGRVCCLRSLGFRVDPQVLRRSAYGCPPRSVSILKALVRCNPHDGRLQPYYADGHFRWRQFWRDFLAPGRPCWVPLELPSPAQAVQRIRDAGGRAVLAHPGAYRSMMGPEGLASLLRELVRAGLDGLEAFSTYHRPGEQRRFARLARRWGLVCTAGSDFHGHRIKPGVGVGQDLGIPTEVREELQEWAMAIVGGRATRQAPVPSCYWDRRCRSYLEDRRS